MIWPVTLREVRLAAGRAQTFQVRTFTPLILLSVSYFLIYLAPLTGRPKFTGPELFRVLFWLAYLLCFLTGLAATIDCISEEKRAGTLGLLLLTRVSTLDVILGKMTGAAVVTGSMLLAAAPMFAFPILLGGVTLAKAAGAVLTLAATLLFSLSLGVFISTLAKRSFHGLVLIAAIAPLYWFAADSLVVAICLSLLLIKAAAWILPLVWREKPFRRRLDVGLIGTAFRQQLQRKNPIFWLAGRARFNSLGFLIALAVALSLVPVVQKFNWGLGSNPLVSYAIAGAAWFVISVLLQLFLLLLVAVKSCQWISETRQAGLLDLLAGTPLTLSQIFAGHWLNLLRHATAALIPTVVATGILLVWFRDIWIFDGGHPMELTRMVKESFAALLYGSVEGGHRPFQYLLVACAILPATWMAIGWIGMWLALRIQKSMWAPILTLLIVVVPSTIVFAPLRGLLDLLAVNHVISIRPGYDLALWTALTLAWQTGASLFAFWKLHKNFHRFAHGSAPTDSPSGREFGVNPTV